MPVYFKNTDKSIIKNILYLKVNSKMASSGPPIGPALGQCGIPSAPFCKDFNERTSQFKSNVPLFVVLYIFNSGEYEFDLILPSTSYLLKKILNLNRGFRKPGYIYSDLQELRKEYLISKYRYVTPSIIYEIFLYKSYYYDWSLVWDFSICKKYLGTVKSMGIFFFFD